MKHTSQILPKSAVRQSPAILNLLKSSLPALALLCGFAASAQTSTTTTNFTDGRTIPDASASGLASAKFVSTPIASMTDLNVTLKITGTFNGDLYAYLTHSSGRSVLLNRVGRRSGSSLGYGDDGLNVKFDDACTNGDVHVYRLTLNGNNSIPIAGALTNIWAPDARTNSPLSVLDTDSRTALLNSFNGLNPNGEWVLFVADIEAGDIHTLDDWGLEITGYTVPSITTNPANQTAECSTGSATFSVTAAGSATLAYQWRHDGSPISGATGASFTINNTVSADLGSYDVVVTNDYGSVTSAVATLTVQDTTAPSITLSGSNPQIVECHGTYTEAGATASDLCNGNLTGSIIVDSSAVNANTVGSYTVSYRVTDASGNSVTNTRTVTVQDTAAPSITLSGSNPQIVECHGTYTEAGATASDLCNGNLTGSIIVDSSAVNANTVGSYTVSYRVTDASGNSVTNTRTVTVQDTAAPSITLSGSNPQIVECHGTYTEAGATASDLCNGNLTGSIIVDSSAVNANTVGSYTVSYRVTDASGNSVTNTRTVTVQDTAAPSITLSGSNPQIVECHGTYTEAGATASDLCNGNLTGSIIVDSSAVNANTVGSYTVSYRVTDASGNSVTNTRTVTVQDTAAPSITLSGSNPQIVECHGTYTEAGATASDLCNGNLTGSIIVDSSAVNANTVGSYTVSYRVTDASGNSVTNTRTVTVQDTAAPSITLSGSNPQIVECHGTYTEAGATASDLCNGNLTGSIIVDSSAVNANTVGSYTVSYRVTDASGNSVTNTRTVTVQDTAAPSITLSGSNPQIVECHGTYTEAGATASDLCNGNLTGSIIVDSSAVNANTVGSYTVSYRVTDASGNSVTNTRTVTVQDTAAPSITLSGSNPQIVECHGTYTEAGATASDLCNGNLTGSIIVDSSAVNANTVGSYTVSYRVTDASGNSVTNTRTVTVQDTAAPSITLSGSNPQIVECHSTYTEAGATASDLCNGNLTGSIIVDSSAVNANTVGSYTVSYRVSDASGNSVTNTRTVTVQDTAAPSITLSGSNPQIVECHGTYTEAGATASDLCNGNLTGSIIVDSSAVNANTVGSYTVSYRVTDASGNSVTNTRTVTVQDTAAPSITLSGSNPQIVECHGTYTEAGATASDLCNGNLTGSIIVDSSAVNANTVGSYTVSYRVTDASGNSVTNTRTVTVQDTAAPSITLSGSNPQIVECHGTYTEAGATASDLCNGNLTGSIIVDSSAVNANTVGSYTVSYRVSDASGNSVTNTRTVTVQDTTAPSITCSSNITVFTANSSGTEVTFTVTGTDLCSGTAAIVSSPASGSVFPVGTTIVTNTASDASGNSNQCTFTVTVLLDNAPVAGNDNMGAVMNQPRSVLIEKCLSNDYDADNDELTVIAVSANSTNGGTVTLSSTHITYTSATNFSGTDRFTYTVSDGHGGVAVGTVVVHVDQADVSANILSITMTATNTVKIRFAGVPGFTYSMERTTSMSPPTWAGIGNITVPTGGIAVFEDMTPPMPTAYYRTAYSLAP